MRGVSFDRKDRRLDSRKTTTRNGSDITFTSVGLGTGPLGELFGKLDEKTAIATVEAAYASGVRMFDSSPHYGNGLAEARLGAGLRGVPRDDIVVSTKIGRIMDPRGEKPKPVPGVVAFAGGHPHAARFDYSYDGAMRSIEHSLLRLGMDRLDIVLIHDCDRWTHGDDAPQRFKEAMDGAYVALDRLRAEKVVKGIGFGINEADTCAKFARAGDFDIGMMAGRHSLLDQSGLAEMLPLALERNIAILVAGVFNSGILATGSVAQAKFEYVDAPPAVLDKVRRLEILCAAHGVSLRQAAIQFAGMHPAVVSVVLGAVRPEEIEANVRDAEAAIPPALWSDMKAAGLLDPAAAIPA
jgi:D-threo-aldose 1-dehydrogenase